MTKLKGITAKKLSSNTEHKPKKGKNSPCAIVKTRSVSISHLINSWVCQGQLDRQQ